MSKTFNITENERALLERNIKLVPWYTMTSLILFVQPVIILFFESKGMEVSDFFFIQPIFSISVLLLEVPISYISDRTRRRHMIISSSIFSIIGTSIIWLAQDIWTIAFYGLAFAIAYCMRHGSQSALLYDSLLALGREGEHKKIIGKSMAYSNYGLAVSAAIGGVTFTINPNLPSILSVFVCFITMGISFFFHEAPRQKISSEKHPIRDILDVIKYTLHGHQELKWIVLFTSCMSVVAIKGYWVIQPVLYDIGTSAIIIALVAGLYRFITGISGQIIHKLEDYINIKKLLMFSVILATLNYILGSMSWGLWLIPSLCLVAVAEGFSHVITHDMIHARTPSKTRATVISVSSMLTRFQFAIVTPLFGVAIDAISLKFAMLSMAAYVIIFIGVAYTMLSRNNVFKKC